MRVYGSFVISSGSCFVKLKTCNAAIKFNFFCYLFKLIDVISEKNLLIFIYCSFICVLAFAYA